MLNVNVYMRQTTRRIRMKMKQIKSFCIVLVGLLALAGLVVSYSMMWPREKEVRCDMIQDILRPTQPSKFLWQIIILALGLIAWLLMFYEVLCGSTKETAKKWKEKICPVILLITGLLVTATLAVVIGNTSGRFSPDFISACKPSEASWKEVCSSFSRTGQPVITAKVTCTTDWTIWAPSRSSALPRFISCLSYSMVTWLLWMLWRPISSTTIPRYIILPITIVFPWLIGMIALNESSADIWDVLSGYYIGAIMAFFTMWSFLPAFYPFIYESELPQHWNDGIPLQTLGKLGFNPDLKKPAAGPAKPPLPIIR